MRDSTWEVCPTMLQADPTTAAPMAAGPMAANGTADAPANSTAPADATGPPARKGPSKAFITKVAVKFVNAMWMSMFAKVLADGLVYRQRTTSLYAVMTTAYQTAYLTPSQSFKSQ